MARQAQQRAAARLGPFDLTIIGGGITGAGAARDAARRGLKVLLLEKGDLATGTSSRSSKLVHGGLRYLETYQFHLVFESVSERRVLQEIAPHLVRPLGFLFPNYAGKGMPPFLMDLGMWLYDSLSLFRSPKLHSRLSSADVARLEPGLGQAGLRGAQLYYDCATDDARLTLETALDAMAAGAVVATWSEVVGFENDAAGLLRRLQVRDVISDEVFAVESEAFILAGGPWTDGLRQRAGLGAGPVLRPTKGVHLMVEHSRLPVSQAVVMFHPDDGRVLFAIPWGSRTYVGTTDTDWSGDPDEVAASGQDILYLLQSANKAFPDIHLEPAHVVATWAGLRPLIAEQGVSTSRVSREHEIRVESNGLVTIAGGKLTTYRRMASELVDRTLDSLAARGRLMQTAREAHTEREPLPGAVGWPGASDPQQVAQVLWSSLEQALPLEVVHNLVRTYGMMGRDVAALALRRPALAAPLLEGRPEILAQVEWAVERELAATLGDVLIRRLSLFFQDDTQGLACAPAVADHMASMLGWEDARRARELASYEAEVSLARRWRVELGLAEA